jgi:tetratricopeptide (TPR) repeat protein
LIEGKTMPIWSAEIKELESLFPSIKGHFPALEKELVQLIGTKDPNVILIYSRRCLEVIVNDLCEKELKRSRKSEPLKGVIDKLDHEEKVPDHIIVSMHFLNSLSTYGAHPKDFDPEQIKPAISNLEIIIKWYLKYKTGKESSGFQVPGSRLKGSGDRAKGEEENLQVAGYSEEGKEGYRLQVASHRLRSKFKWILILLFVGVLAAAVIFAYPRLFKKDKFESLKSSDGRISVAVMPFQNMTNDSVWDIWQEGIQNNLITSLSNSSELKVRQPEAISGLIQSAGLTNYASITPLVAGKISQKLDANIFISGSINQAGPIIRVNAQLIDSRTQEVFKSFQLNGTSEGILDLLDSLSIEVKNFLILSGLKKGRSPDDFQQSATTSSPEAYGLFLLGNKAYRNTDYHTAYKMYLQALAIDSNFMEVALKLSIAYYNNDNFDEAKKWCLKAYEKRDQMPLQLKINTNRVYAMLFETHYEEIKYLRQIQEMDDLLPGTYYSLGYAYSMLFQFERAIPEYERALEIYDKLEIKPAWVFNYLQLAQAYNKTGQYQKEEKLLKKAEGDFPDNFYLWGVKGFFAAGMGDTVNAKKYLEKAMQIAKDNSWTDPDLFHLVAQTFVEWDLMNYAEDFYRKAYCLEPEKPSRMNDLAFILIDRTKNIQEGIELLNKALKLSPDNYLLLDTKGWGLYKQGKYQEALEVLQKSWDLRREKAVYNHPAYLRLEEVKKAAIR